MLARNGGDNNRSSSARSRGHRRLHRDALMVLIGAGTGLFVTTIIFVLFGHQEQRLPVSSSQTTRQQLLTPPPPPYYSNDNYNGNRKNREVDSGRWNDIHVYYGKMDHLIDPLPPKKWIMGSPRHANGTIWLSQHGQDVAVAKVLNFKRSGFFVDLAANDAVWSSNSFVFERNFGWKGICIEANPLYWYRLAFRTNCTVVGAVVGSGGSDGSDRDEVVNVTLGTWRGTGPFGGIVGKEFDNKRVADKNVEVRSTISLRTILRRFRAPAVIDYLSLDVEGAETFILKDFAAWDEFTFLCMTIERPKEDLQRLLRMRGYSRVLNIKGGDTLWVHHSIDKQARTNLAKHPREVPERSLKRALPNLLR